MHLHQVVYIVLFCYDPLHPFKMADISVDNKSTNENGTKEGSEASSKTDIEKEENLKNAESDKAVSKNIIDNDVKCDTSDKNSETPAIKGIAVPASSSSSCPSISFTKDEDTKLNHTSSPLRPSMWGGGGGSSSGSGAASSSLFGSTSICSPVFSSCSSSSSSSSNSFPRNLFAKSNLSSSPWPVINRSPVLHKPVLRPSQLAATPGSSGSSSTDTPPRSNPFVLNPPKLANPFAKTPAKDATSDDEPAGLSSEGSSDCKRMKSGSPTISSTINIQDSVETSSAAGQQGKQQELDNTKSSSNSSSSSSSNTNVSTSVTTSSSLPVSFVPLSAPPGSTQSTPIRLPSSSSSAHTPGTSSTPGFVFGQNLHERVIVEPSGSQAGTSSSSDSTVPFHDGAIPSTANAVAATNGTSTEMLFTSVIQKELPDKNPEGNGSTDDKSKKSLSESAREYEESRAVKRKYEEVTVVTGEEEENNILQMDCKLFVYDGSKFNYSEGVHGSLRVNDPPVTAKKVTQSRVIVRMSGTLRVLMNTKIWAGMKIEKPNRKIVRMTAMDSVGQIKVFLISSSPSESDMLYRVLESRIKLQKDLTGACQNGTDTDSSKPESSQ